MPDLADSGRRPAGSMIHAIGSVVAIVVALIFFFPIYWSLSTSLRNPLDTSPTETKGTRMASLMGAPDPAPVTRVVQGVRRVVEPPKPAAPPPT